MHLFYIADGIFLLFFFLLFPDQPMPSLPNPMILPKPPNLFVLLVQSLSSCHYSSLLLSGHNFYTSPLWRAHCVLAKNRKMTKNRAVFEFVGCLYENIQLDMHHAADRSLVRLPAVPDPNASGLSRQFMGRYQWAPGNFRSLISASFFLFFSLSLSSLSYTLAFGIFLITLQNQSFLFEFFIGMACSLMLLQQTSTWQHQLSFDWSTWFLLFSW